MCASGFLQVSELPLGCSVHGTAHCARWDPRSQMEKSKAPSMHIFTSLLLTILLSTANFNLFFKSYIETTYLFEKQINNAQNEPLSFKHVWS